MKIFNVDFLIISSFFLTQVDIVPWLPQTLFGGMSFIAGILIFLLPETGKNVFDKIVFSQLNSFDSAF